MTTVTSTTIICVKCHIIYEMVGGGPPLIVITHNQKNQKIVNKKITDNQKIL